MYNEKRIKNFFVGRKSNDTRVRYKKSESKRDKYMYICIIYYNYELSDASIKNRSKGARNI